MASPDVAANQNTTSTLTLDMVQMYLKEKLLSLAAKQLVFYELGDKEDLPEGNGKSVQFTRYERLSLPNAPLAEGQTPDSQTLTTSVVQAIVDQWGAVVSLTDVAELTVKHPVMKIAQMRLSTQHNETVDREIQRVLSATSNVSFPNSRSSRAGLLAGDVLSTDDIRKQLATLRFAGAEPFDGSNYVGVFDPSVEMDITKDATFVNAAAYSNIKALMNGEVGTWMGVRWKRSNFLPVITRVANSGAGVTFSTTATLNSFTGFTATTGTVLAKVTKLDPVTGAETTIVDESASLTNGSAFGITIAIAGGTLGNGTYNVYATLEGGASGTETLQYRVTISDSSTVTVTIYKAIGTGTLVTSGASPRIVVSATGPVAPASGSSAGTVHTTYIFGKESFGVVDLAGMKTYITPSTPTDSDPLVQRRKAGWKQIFKAVIKNPDFFRRIESLSAY